ncbi:MAG: uracil-DNA glycosylase [Syntrophobacteraceae bacterium]|nr:uracil-DNA glycosylase [Syntrophobacteraceae bacterium]
MDNARVGVCLALRELRTLLTGLREGGLADWPTTGHDTEDSRVRSLPPGIHGSAQPAFQEEDVVPDGFPIVHDPAASFKDRAKLLDEIRAQLGDCRRCRLHADRKRIVFGDGSPTANLVFVGEGPGLDEDREGLPFVGRAGKLLDKMIQSLGFQRKDVYICNIVKCRPPGNRTPGQDEIEICSPFLLQQLHAVRPRAICALGSCAAKTLLGTHKPISQLRGKRHMWRGIPLICTFHPAYLLRNPAQKAAVWDDLLEIRAVLGSVVPLQS